MTLADPTMPQRHDDDHELHSQRYMDVLKQPTKKTNDASDLHNDTNNPANGNLADPKVERAPVRNDHNSRHVPPSKKRQQKNAFLPKLVEHLNIKDRSNSVPALFPPILSKSQDMLPSRSHDSVQKLQPRSFQQEKTISRDCNAALTNRDNVDRGLKKIKLPLPPKFAIYRKVGSKGENLYNVPEPLMERNNRLETLGRKRPGHSVTQDKRKAALMKAQALSQSCDNFNFSRILQAPGDNPVSVRRKIDKFHKWHEEQYLEKAEKAKVVPERSKNGKMPNGKITAMDGLNNMEPVDNLKGVPVELASRELIANDLLPYIHIPDDPIRYGKVLNNNNRQMSSPPAHVPLELAARPTSSVTWKTWRGVNESDAYDDVQKYIKENELLSEEKRQYITDWVMDAERSLRDKTPDVLAQLADTAIPEESISY